MYSSIDNQKISSFFPFILKFYQVYSIIIKPLNWSNIMKVAVTAASGNLGKAIIDQLIKQLPKDQIIGIARTPEKANELGIEIRKGDYSNKKDFLEALKGVDTVLVVSGMDAPNKRIIQHRGIIEAAKEVDVQKIVYTSIIGVDKGNAFSLIVNSNRQTEKDVQASGLNWVIGRNGLYIEPDIEYLGNYIKDGKIANCAADGKCSYTTRDELAYAYTQMILDDRHNSKIYNLVGDPITQQELTDYINRAFGTNLIYQSMSIEDYIEQRKAELGEFLGTIIGGIYTGIRNGDAEIESNFKEAAGREHISWEKYFSGLSK
jgi:NAD(P)H dehydrogenase (quinone)